MTAAVRQYDYFESLEKRIKSALAVYLVLFALGMISTILGMTKVVSFAVLHPAMFLAASGMFVFIAFGSFLVVIGKVDWLGDLHIKLDKKFFGFLEKSNDTIFHTLLSVLGNGERKHFQNLPADKKGTIAQSIFSHLSDDDNYLFNKLMNSGIFQNWIWYWISIYGTFAFTILTVSSFAAAWIKLAFFSREFFACFWGLALLHLFVSIFIGKFLVNKTKTTVQAIVDAHQMDIANVLVSRIHDQPEPEPEAELHETDG